MGIDGECNLSLLNYQREGKRVGHLEEGDIDIGDIHLVGIGAIGCAAVWTLSKCDFLKGSLRLIDPEEVSLSNLQRYVLCSQTDVQQKCKKVEVAIQALKGNHGLNVNGYATASAMRKRSMVQVVMISPTSPRRLETRLSSSVFITRNRGSPIVQQFYS
jgi:ThiF family